jgi:hypothetical protein
LVRGFQFKAGKPVGDLLLVNSGVNITSFAEDSTGEIYALSQNGRIYLLTS